MTFEIRVFHSINLRQQPGAAGEGSLGLQAVLSVFSNPIFVNIRLIGWTGGSPSGKNDFHLIGLDSRGVIVLKCKLSRRGQLANIPPCLIGMGACAGGHPLSRRLFALGHS
jgi:hypothetical protein